MFELQHLCSFSDIILVIKLRRMRWAGHVVRLGDRRGAYRVWCGNVREGDHVEDLGIGGMLIVKWILRSRRGDAEWIDVAHDKDRWCALVTAGMNLQVP
jgi:hypothetical protein